MCRWLWCNVCAGFSHPNVRYFAREAFSPLAYLLWCYCIDYSFFGSQTTRQTGVRVVRVSGHSNDVVCVLWGSRDTAMMWCACCEGLGTQQWCSYSIFHTVSSSQAGAFQMFFFSFPHCLLFTGGSLSAFFPCSCPPWHSATWATHSGQERSPCDSNGYRWSLRMAPILVHMLLEGISFWCSCDEVGVPVMRLVFLWWGWWFKN